MAIEKLDNIYTPSQYFSFKQFLDFGYAFRKAWDKETCYGPYKDGWSEDNPAYGQCGVTSAVTVHILGCGIILFDKPNDHCGILLPDDAQEDLAREQFSKGRVIRWTDAFTLDEFLADPETKTRFELLLERVEKLLN